MCLQLPGMMLVAEDTMINKIQSLIKISFSSRGETKPGNSVLGSVTGIFGGGHARVSSLRDQRGYFGGYATSLC